MRDNKNLKGDRDKIVKGLEETYRRLIEYKRQKNSPVIIIRDGKIVAADPFTMPSTTTYKRNSG